MYNVGVPDRKMCEIIFLVMKEAVSTIKHAATTKAYPRVTVCRPNKGALLARTISCTATRFPARKALRLIVTISFKEARRRGLRRRRPNSPQEYMGMPLPTTSSDMECYSDNIHVCSIDCWDECHKPHFCPQLRVMGKKDESTNVVYMCNDCPQIPPPPPPPPPRKCCDRDPDLTQKYQDSCPKNPDGPKFPVPADSCILARKRQKFLERERKKQLGVGKPQPDMYMDESNCQANPEPIRGANACYYQGIDEQLPTPSAIDALPGYRPVRQAMVQSQPKSMRDWVKIAGNRPAMNCKNYKPY